tara:strand:+ start:226 stop:843 length:618 start_codon:yes stop_codon:yes gene_type:complete
MQGLSQKMIAGAVARHSWRKPIRKEEVTMAVYNERCAGNFQKCGDIVLDETESRQTTLLVKIPPELNARWSRETEHIYAIVRKGEVMKLGGTRTGMKKRWDSYKCGHCVPQRIQKRSGEPFPGKMSVTNAHLYHTIEADLLEGGHWEFWSWELPAHNFEVEMPTGVKVQIATQTYHAYESWSMSEFQGMAGHIPQLCNNSDPNYR